jgi:hypothetical protein
MQLMNALVIQEGLEDKEKPSRGQSVSQSVNGRPQWRKYAKRENNTKQWPTALECKEMKPVAVFVTGITGPTPKKQIIGTPK